MFPTDIYGKHINSLPGNAVNVYKHVGGGQYELVYSKGTKIEHSLPDNEKTISGILPLGALGLLIKQMEKERQQGNDRPNQ